MKAKKLVKEKTKVVQKPALFVCFPAIGGNVVLDIIYSHILTGLLLIDIDCFIHLTSSLVLGSSVCPGLASAASGLVGKKEHGLELSKGGPRLDSALRCLSSRLTWGTNDEQEASYVQ